MHLIAAAIICVLPLAACAGDAERDPSAQDTTLPGAETAQPDSNAATAAVRDTSGRELGFLMLSGDDGIVVSGHLAGLPAGEHGMHLHSVGSCEPPAFESAGDHWNPGNSAHGKDADGGPHAGDFENIEVSEGGSVIIDRTAAAGMAGGLDSLLDSDGAAIIIHAGRDDYTTQPSGDSGDPIACGVVTRR